MLKFNEHIIIEGENKTGKSTLVRELCKLDPTLCYHHFGFPQGDSNDEKYGYQRGQFELMFKFLEEMKHTNTRFIFDRSHIGEYWWSNKYRNRDPLYLFGLEKLHSALPIRIVNVICDPATIQDRMISHGEIAPNIDEITLNQVKIYEACQLSIYPKSMINTTNKSIEDSLAHLIQAIQHDPTPKDNINKKLENSTWQQT